jgi:hypothetical protein
MERWVLFSDPNFQLRFSYPAPTPQGHPVEKLEDRRDDAVRVHLSSEGSQELYFEVVRFRDLAPQAEYERHKVALGQRSDGVTITELSETRLNSLPAYTYSFKWPHRQRAAILIPKDQDTYRVIYDPLSPLNADILSSVALVE